MPTILPPQTWNEEPDSFIPFSFVDEDISAAMILLYQIGFDDYVTGIDNGQLQSGE